MDAFVWSEKYVTGIESVDAQHQRLVTLTNAFGAALTHRVEVSPDQLELTFEALTNYATEHFADEEALMRTAWLDARYQAEHRRQHRGFLDQVGLMRQELQRGPALGEELARVLMRFLVSWLAFHILGADQQMARQLAKVERGVTPREAWASESRGGDHPAEVILGAIDELLRVVAARNRELGALNASLEQRVAQRTAELSAANAELKATQESLIETAKLASVGQLASGLAHEINNPLAFIGPNVEVMAELSERLLGVAALVERAVPQVADPALRAELEARCREADLAYVRAELPGLAKDTKVGLRRVQAIVRDLKDFSRVEGAPLQMVDLNHCFDSVLSVLPAARTSGLVVHRAFGAPAPVSCLAAQLNQALLAVVSNAVQAVADGAPRPGSITLATGQQQDEVWAEVADTGVGMTPEVLAHLFEPFFTTRPPGKGLGLGLAAARRFALHHGGRLEVASAPGQGTRVRLWLPTRPAAPSRPADGRGGGEPNHVAQQ